ncbi:hypothetical protein [Deinococcus soli (ex Cha et al. 2016)]|uniref:Uncharacterized protein n=1 Tax=Deinococcus soli (ex Cha et al. 2016) TaxID=1309411 RepID=A0ACC6KP04_9DEIO|nr:hypothetical protein [Deinococcus soli (ex Cha et al. 2016)]MDR6330595.1 hypothetical protein [Deinococcus soli (ex Cha et al. 2016)]MDR6754372.1 hypothetical protein [Deinococcus soli (ex Cha et al. 2016)]
MSAAQRGTVLALTERGLAGVTAVALADRLLDFGLEVIRLSA